MIQEFSHYFWTCDVGCQNRAGARGISLGAGQSRENIFRDKANERYHVRRIVQNLSSHNTLKKMEPGTKPRMVLNPKKGGVPLRIQSVPVSFFTFLP